jgi:hypothetical protein
MTPGDAGLSADPLGHEMSVLEERVEKWPDRAARVSQFIGAFDLPRDLSFTDDQTIQTRHNAEQVVDRRSMVMLVQVRKQLRGRELVQVGKEFRNEGQGKGVGSRFKSAGRIAFRQDDCRPLFVGRDPSQIELNPIAGAQDYSFAAISSRQIIESDQEPVLIDHKLLAQFQGSGPMAAANSQEHHGPPPGLKLVWAVIRLNNRRAKAMFIRNAKRRPLSR